jgi:hypothetical protein
MLDEQWICQILIRGGKAKLAQYDAVGVVL